MQGKGAELKAMYQEWPFFQSTMDLVEMILAKADMRIASMYDDVLVSSDKEKQLGQMLRGKFLETVDAVLEVGVACQAPYVRACVRVCMHACHLAA